MSLVFIPFYAPLDVAGFHCSKANGVKNIHQGPVRASQASQWTRTPFQISRLTKSVKIPLNDTGYHWIGETSLGAHRDV